MPSLARVHGLSRRRTLPIVPLTSYTLLHERQVLQRCGLHAINALHGGPVRAHTSRTLAALARTLPGFKARSLASPLGNYDVNLLTAALAAPRDARPGLRATWVRRGNVGDVLAAGRALVNLRMGKSGYWNVGRHWVAVVRTQGRWWLVDSEEEGCKTFAGAQGVSDFLSLCWSRGGQVLSVTEDFGD